MWLGGSMSASLSEGLEVDRMCVVELATALELAGDSGLYPHGFRAPGSKVIWGRRLCGPR